MTNKKAETKEEEVKKVIELEEGELEDVSGGGRDGQAGADGDNTWCDEGC